MYQAHQNFQRQMVKRHEGKLRTSYPLPVTLPYRPSPVLNFHQPQIQNGFPKPQIPIGKEVRDVKMVHSPEIKINLENIEQPPVFFPKNINLYQQNQRCSYETLKTSSTSTESLLSSSNHKTNINIINPNNILNNSVRSQENLLIQPFTLNMCNNEYFHKRKISMTNLMTNTPFNLNTNNTIFDRNFPQINKKASKCYYNKFNSPSENSNNENTIILTLRIKIAENDYRVFNLKKFDDLFISLQKFFDLNQIKQDLIKPIVNKIFNALNRIFWLLNNKIGLYDQEYLNSLYNLWKKNKGKIPKIRVNENDNKSKKLFHKSFTEGYEERKHKSQMNNKSF